MTLLIALVWIIPIILILSILVYGHVVVMSIGIKLFLVVKNCFSKKSKAPCIEDMKQVFTKDLFLSKEKYKDISLLKMGFGLFFAGHFLFFLVSYFTYVNDDTKYHKAKAYYAVGAVPHLYSVALGHVNTPLYPPLLVFNAPITKIKEILFEKSVEYIPKDDRERELWEYEWFYYPYVIKSYDMWGEYVPLDSLGGDCFAKEEHYNYFKNRLDKLFNIMKTINTEHIEDKSLSLNSRLDFGAMARYYFMNEKYLAPYENLNRDTIAVYPTFLKTNKTLFERRKKIEKWLFDTKNIIEKMPEFKSYVKQNKKTILMNKSILDSTLLLYIEVGIFSDIEQNAFSCMSKRVISYKNLRTEFLEKSSLTKILDLGYQEDWFKIYAVTVRNTQSEFIRQLINKECQIDVPGHSREVSNGRDILDVNSSIYRDILKKLYKNNNFIEKQDINTSREQYSSQEIVVIDNLEYQNTQFKERTWFEAKAYCSELNLYGTGWRLPNIDELEKIASVKMQKVENQPDNWRKENFPKNANPVKGEKKWYLFLNPEFIKNLSDFSLMVNIWTSEEIWHPQFKSYAYRMEFWMGGTSLTSKDRKLGTTALCVRAKNY